MIKVHHLNRSRSLYCLWLLEELGLDYELALYERGPDFRAPAALRTAHPLGKAPVVETEGVVLTEMGAIAMWMIQRHGPELGPGEGAAAEAEWLTWMHYAEGSAFLPLLLNLLLGAERDGPGLIQGFAKGETALHLGYIRDKLGAGPFILGERFSGPDIGVGYMAGMAGRLKLLGDYPELAAYHDRLTARPAFQRALAKGGA